MSLDSGGFYSPCTIKVWGLFCFPHSRARLITEQGDPGPHPWVNLQGERKGLMAVKVRERPKGSGIYWIFINHQGKRKSKKIGDEGPAQEVSKKIEAKIVLGDVGILNEAPKIPTFKECAELWFALPHDWKESTRELYDMHYRKHILPHFGKWRINEIRRKHLKAFFDKLLAGGLKAPTLGSIKPIINGFFQHAVESEVANR